MHRTKCTGTVTNRGQGCRGLSLISMNQQIDDVVLRKSSPFQFDVNFNRRYPKGITKGKYRQIMYRTTSGSKNTYERMVKPQASSKTCVCVRSPAVQF